MLCGTGVFMSVNGSDDADNSSYCDLLMSHIVELAIGYWTLLKGHFSRLIGWRVHYSVLVVCFVERHFPSVLSSNIMTVCIKRKIRSCLCLL